MLPFTKTLSNDARRFSGLISVRNLKSKQLIITEFGDPIKVVKMQECEIPKLRDRQVLVRMLAAPINPSDINTIQGKYPVKLTLPLIPGNEGVGIVKENGPNACLDIDSKVILIKPVQGTWRNYAVLDIDTLKPVHSGLGLAEASTITVNPCCAYRMLLDFVPVKQRRLVVIQNGANSACGQNVIQICKAWKIPNIAVIRDRPKAEPLKEYLRTLGATYVFTHTELSKTDIFKTNKVQKPSLALNCVGGKSSMALVRHLQPSGCMVTYGGMSMQPVTIPTSALIFKDVKCLGFWTTKWNELADFTTKDKMLNDIIALMCCGKLKAPVHQMIKLNSYQKALKNTLSKKGFIGVKYILDFE